MFQASKVWGSVRWPSVRAHLCTVAVSLTWNSSWRVPREGFRYGGLAYGVVLTLALVAVAAPLTLLQLAVGQLSQQDAVGIWRAVPFFRGIGYIRLLISFVSAAYTMVYLSLTIAYLLYTATHNIPFPDCIQLVENEEEYVNVMNATECLRITFLSPVSDSPEYFIALALIITVLWIGTPFLFYSSVKLMKRIMYTLAPIVIILAVVIISCLGDRAGLASFVGRDEWRGLAEPYVWSSAVVQALWSCQLAGGFLIVAGDSVYADTNVQWTSIAITCTNIAASWLWLVFWFAVSGPREHDSSAVAVLLLVYEAAEGLQLAWPLLLYLVLILSGVVTMLVLLYPVYNRLRRIGGVKWRLTMFGCSLGGAGISLAMLAGRLSVLAPVEDLAVPFLVCAASVVEILALGFIYGWRNLIEDVEFLISGELIKFWVWGWWLAPAIITAAVTWWLIHLFVTHPGESWAQVDEASAVLTAAAIASAIFILCAGISVGKQVQYDFLEKLKSSFQPSRHWGPRDPITHYYWLASREDTERGNAPRTRYHRRELGQFSRRISFLTTSGSIHSKIDLKDVKQRSNSDDWLYTTGRKSHPEIYKIDERKRSKSLDWDIPRKSQDMPSIETLAREGNNNIEGFEFARQLGGNLIALDARPTEHI